MTGRYRNIMFTLFFALVLPNALRAQEDNASDGALYHSASVYYVTLHDATGETVNSKYAATDGIVKAFVGGTLRGASQWQQTDNDEGVFVIRVWGNEADEATATFRLQDHGVEYEISSQPFAQGEEGTYGSPSEPIAMTIIPVTGISLPFSAVTLKQTETVSVKPTLLPANHSELTTDLKYEYSCNSTAFSVSNNGMITGVSVGQGIVTVRVTPGNFTAEATIHVEAGQPYVAVTEIRNNMASTSITMTEGDHLQLDYSIVPDNATNKAVSFKNDYDIVDILQETETALPTLVAKKAGKSTLTVISADNTQITLTYIITVEERIVPDVTLTFEVQQLTASKLHDTMLTIVKKADDVVYPDLTDLVFSTVQNGEAAATATRADATGLRWNIRGLYVGRHTVKIKYNGKEQAATCTLEIPAEITFRNGWDWISLYTATPYSLTDNAGDYLQSLRTDDQNRIIEIRSQKATLYYDGEFGYFGDLTTLTAADGAYKMKSTYEAANETSKVLNLGTTPGGQQAADMMPQVTTGYTWIAYPHEHSHKVSTLHDVLAATASPGDMIIGRDAFLEYDGASWQGSLKTFEAGRGYIYYTENSTPFRLDWGDYYMSREHDANAAARDIDISVDALWQYDALKYASSMPVVAQLTDRPSADGVVVGAFVNGECRGRAVADSQGLLFLSVTGNPGERVSFKIYDTASAHCYDLEQTVTFGSHKGSLRAPLLLDGEATGIGTAQSEPLSITFDGTTIKVGGATSQQQPSVTVYNMAGHIILTSAAASTVPVGQLPKGVYVVKATCGRSATTIKIAK